MLTPKSSFFVYSQETKANIYKRTKAGSTVAEMCGICTLSLKHTSLLVSLSPYVHPFYAQISKIEQIFHLFDFVAADLSSKDKLKSYCVGWMC